MFAKTINKLTKTAILCGIAAGAMGHGLIEDPPSRAAFCGIIEKPDNATTQACIDAFANSGSAGYQFMSILTHDIGRKGSRSNNVCSFDSETWNGQETVWDKPVDWPTSRMSAGANDFVWNISWGPHFDDTEEFVYYITKPDFVFQVGVPLTWDDFEEQPFCDLGYNDNSPNANSMVVSDKGAVTFKTTCNVPSRSGRHVIYGEWGRNQWTYERFHSCVDVVFDGGVNPTPTPEPPTPTPPPPPVTPTPTPPPGVTPPPVTPTPTPPPSNGSGASCEHVITSTWGSGFQGEIRIINTSDSTIYGWNINWSYRDGSTVDQVWNADYSVDGVTTSASNLGWNSTIEPGETVSFGYIGTGGGAISPITGDVCQ